MTLEKSSIINNDADPDIRAAKEKYAQDVKRYQGMQIDFRKLEEELVWMFCEHSS